LRYWNAVFSGGYRNEGFDAFLFRVLGLDEVALHRARRVFDLESLRAWMRTLPLLSQIVGDRVRTAAILGRFLEEGVALEDGRSAKQATQPAQRLRIAGDTRRTRGRQRHRALGRATLGTATRCAGGALRVRIGPLTPGNAERFRGLPYESGGPAEGGAVITLGPVCEFDRYWESWEHGRGGELAEAVSATHWPRLVYLLEHLMPAAAVIEVHLLPERAPWRLGAEAKQPPETGAYSPSTLGAYTLLEARPAATG
jgi:hypothetical protein